MKESDGSQGNPTPALFSAVTRNWYSWSATKSLTLCDNVLPSVFLTRVHLSFFLSYFSRMYDVIQLPPSEMGSVQTTVASVSVISEIFGLPELERNYLE